MKKIIIFTNKDIHNLSRDNGHDYRLMKLLEYDKKDIVFINHADQLKSFSFDYNIIIDIPGLSFRKYYRLVKSLNIRNKTLFIQDSFFRYSINKFVTLIQNKCNLKDILKSFYHILYSFGNELLISIYFSKVGYVSNNDFFLPIFFKKKYFVVKNGVSISSSAKMNKSINRKQIKLFFWGNLAYGPNRDSLLVFIQSYWDILQKTFTDIELHIYGKYNNDLLLELENNNINNIFLEGKFNTHESLFESNDIFINFIQYGSGIKNKTLEALAYEVPMICSHHSLEGIDEIKEYKYVYSNVDELIKAINLIIDNYDLESIQRNARIVKEIYTWENAYNKYIEEVKS